MEWMYTKLSFKLKQNKSTYIHRSWSLEPSHKLSQKTKNIQQAQTVWSLFRRNVSTRGDSRVSADHRIG
jgi:hypothetical protein